MLRVRRKVKKVLGKGRNNVGKILVVEDNDNNLELVTKILEKKYDLCFARDGFEAVEKFVKCVPDLILMDIKLPGQSGLDATKKIREIDRNIPIIALTASVFDFDYEAAVEAGCNDFVGKPMDIKELFNKIEKYLGQKR